MRRTTHWCECGSAWILAVVLEAGLAICGALRGATPIGALHYQEPVTMTKRAIETSRSTSPAVLRKTRKQETLAAVRTNKTSSKRRRAVDTTAIMAPPRSTKQESVLLLLSRKGGASLDEVMEATGWQKHSVRGFFAGTVKKKLGFNLVSSVKQGEARRYRIETGTGR